MSDRGFRFLSYFIITITNHYHRQKGEVIHEID